MLTFEITQAALPATERCTITGAYSGSRCREMATVSLVVVAVFNDERGRVPFRNYRLCAADAATFVEGYRANAGASVVVLGAP